MRYSAEYPSTGMSDVSHGSNGANAPLGGRQVTFSSHLFKCKYSLHDLTVGVNLDHMVEQRLSVSTVKWFSPSHCAWEELTAQPTLGCVGGDGDPSGRGVIG